MTIASSTPPVTSRVSNIALPLRPTTRLRETGSGARTVSISLKPSDRKAAMDASRRLAETIRAFHLDNPEATWQQLREHLIWVAESLLSSAMTCIRYVNGGTSTKTLR